MLLMPLLAVAFAAQSPQPARSSPLVTPSTIVEGAPATAWRTVPADRLLLIELADGGRVAIELAEAFAPLHIANIRRLARAGWYDGGAVYRVQDNYVVQWGDGTEKKPLPPGVSTKLPAEYDRESQALALRPFGYRDGYVADVGYADGWPVARANDRAWLPHCYGMVGVGRDLSPDTGTGAELYAVIGQAPRQLDRNITVVGRVIDGMEALTARPRGTKALGFYERPDQWAGIVSVRIAADLPVNERRGYQVFRTDTPEFAAWIRSRANRKDDFYVLPANGLDICNAMPPTRAAPER